MITRKLHLSPVKPLEYEFCQKYKLIMISESLINFVDNTSLNAPNYIIIGNVFEFISF